jgi:peptidyl-prolyl cis-trans isomerase A (cyclophilin A)
MSKLFSVLLFNNGLYLKKVPLMLKSILVVLFALFSFALTVMVQVVDAAETSHILLKTSKGDIELVLDNQKAPVSTRNFIDYVKKGYYDKTIFHRVIPGFMIQGGGVVVQDGKMQQKVTEAPIKNEADNGLRNLRGTISMARTDEKDSATSQFFINVVDNSSLDHGSLNVGYAVFGKVVKGMDVVDRISQVETNDSVPIIPIEIWSATILP